MGIALTMRVIMAGGEGTVQHVSEIRVGLAGRSPMNRKVTKEGIPDAHLPE